MEKSIPVLAKKELHSKFKIDYSAHFLHHFGNDLHYIDHVLDHYGQQLCTIEHSETQSLKNNIFPMLKSEPTLYMRELPGSEKLPPSL